MVVDKNLSTLTRVIPSKGQTWGQQARTVDFGLLGPKAPWHVGGKIDKRTMPYLSFEVDKV